MTPQTSPESPLTRLVLFIVVLAIAGTFVAGIHFFAVDLPAQKTIQAPENLVQCTTITCLPKGYPEGCDAFCTMHYPDTHGACVEECVQWMTS
jgi:hypothetical protein